MPFFSRSLLQELAVVAPATERAAALLELGEYTLADGALAEVPAAGPGVVVLRSRLLAASGELVAALDLLEAHAPGERHWRARLLGSLGRVSEGLLLVAGDSAEDRWVRAELHLAAAERGPASMAMPGAPLDAGEGPAWQAVGESAWQLLKAELALAEERPEPAVASLRVARRHALHAGSATLAARSLGRLGEAHARLGNRWRSLRAVTAGLDLTSSGRVATSAALAVYLDAAIVYRLFDHPDLAQHAISTGHDQVIRMASGIEDRSAREAFLIDNRDCQRIIGLWKGNASWGLDLARG